jgi:hypothetical protein
MWWMRAAVRGSPCGRNKGSQCELSVYGPVPPDSPSPLLARNSQTPDTPLRGLHFCFAFPRVALTLVLVLGLPNVVWAAQI